MLHKLFQQTRFNRNLQFLFRQVMINDCFAALCIMQLIHTMWLNNYGTEFT